MTECALTVTMVDIDRTDERHRIRVTSDDDGSERRRSRFERVCARRLEVPYVRKQAIHCIRDRCPVACMSVFEFAHLHASAPAFHCSFPIDTSLLPFNTHPSNTVLASER